MEQTAPSGYEIVLGDVPGGDKGGWQETPLPRPVPRGRPSDLDHGAAPPAEIVELKRMIRESRKRHPDMAGASIADQARDFVEQARYMEAYEDEAPFRGPFFQYQPSYRSLRGDQLRGYFGWRTQVRKGTYRRVPVSVAYIYIYELLNCVGADTPQEALARMEEFEEGYWKSATDPGGLRGRLRRWKFDFSVLQGLPPETARKYASPGSIRRDDAIAVLRAPDLYSDEQVFEALMTFSEKGRRESPAVTSDLPRAHRLFAGMWRRAQAFAQDGVSLFALCFGEMKRKFWYPMWGALYSEPLRGEDRVYDFSPARTYELKGGLWYTHSYDRSLFDLERLRGFLHAADRKLRRYLKTGRNLKPRESESWAETYIDEVIREYEEERQAALKPVITINRSSLDRIRSDAAVTRDSLMTDEEAGGAPLVAERVLAPAAGPDASERGAEAAGILSSVQQEILRSLLDGTGAGPVLQREHLMPSIAADELNEALFDELGDNLVVSDNDELQLVEEYREEARCLAGGGSRAGK